MIHLIFQAMKILQKLIFKLYENMTMKNIELAMITTYVQLKQYFATIQIDDDVLYSLYIGITLGVCIVTFLIMYPGEPIADFSESAEETALKAMKRKIYEEEEEEDDGSNLKLYNNFTSRAVNTTWTTLNTHLRNNKVVNPPQIHKYEVFITSSLLSKFRCVLRRTVYNILVYYIYTTLKQ